MKTKFISIFVIGIILFLTSLAVKPLFTGEIVSFDNKKRIKLGYCPTMHEDAERISKKENYELIKFGSASEVLGALNEDKIDKALVGRKAKKYELNSGINEKIIESGYTLVSNEKSFISYSQLSDLEFYTYLSRDIVEDLIPENSQVIYLDKENVFQKTNQGKTALISWDDWKDDFELVVVVDGNKKIEDFRGVFLYELE